MFHCYYNYQYRTAHVTVSVTEENVFAFETEFSIDQGKYSNDLANPNSDEYKALTAKLLEEVIYTIME